MADASKWKLMPSDHTWVIPICPYCGMLLACDPSDGDWTPADWISHHDHSDVHDPSIPLSPKFVRVRELARGEKGDLPEVGDTGFSASEWRQYDATVDSMREEQLREALKREGRLRASALLNSSASRQQEDS